jgi:hypothetical protein
MLCLSMNLILQRYSSISECCNFVGKLCVIALNLCILRKDVTLNQWKVSMIVKTVTCETGNGGVQVGHVLILNLKILRIKFKYCVICKSKKVDFFEIS